MPYINKDDRLRIDDKLNGFTPRDGGELQYAIARMIENHYSAKESVRYKDMEAMMGALNGANIEHYRCVVAPYEEKKIRENGGVYGQHGGKSY